MNYNQQQDAIIAADGQIVLTPAFAGAGKSTTLDGFSRFRPKSRIINICFSKSVQLAADKRFPENVTNKTSHALAFPKFGSKFMNAKKLSGEVKPNDIKQFVPKNMSPTVSFVFAANVLSIICNFISSPDLLIDVKHLKNIPNSKYYDLADLLPVAIKVWSNMVDLESSAKVTHDVYLKLWQLSNPSFDRYDYILLDEAQDTTPCVIDVFSKQRARKIIVGDSHQSIFQFRGAVDAMRMFKPDIELPLTTSYRFGPNIALLANMLIQSFCEEPYLLEGYRQSDQIGTVDKSKPYAVIAKTNIGLFDQAVDAVQDGLRIHYIGGIQGYGLDLIMDVYYLRTGEIYSIRDAFIRSFQTYMQFTEYADDSEDVGCKNLIKITDNYGAKIPELIARIKAANVSIENSVQPSSAIEDIYNAQVFLTTAHKSKGLEFNQVILSEDFSNLIDRNEYAHPDDLSDADRNLHYVALTRAKHVLQLNQQLKDFVVVFKQKRLQRQQAKKTAQA
ncbi:MAG: 3'-5' exonuclease [Methylophilus sp.]|uniref:3'-5' exonuclease n=1 Tax=Methylophilus sp. TaxID=29541 RepID=UPI003FA110BF